MDISETVRTAILDFVDSVVPEGGDSVWLTGSRVRGDARPDSDWDVLVYSPHAPSTPDDLFKYNQKSRHTIDGGHVELVIAHPNHRDDPRPYMVECRQSGVRLR